MVVWLQVKFRGRELSLWPIGRTPALCVTEKRRCSCGMRLVVLYKCLCAYAFAYQLTVRLNKFWRLRAFSGRQSYFLELFTGSSP